jgi:hypothetical protein
LKKGNPKMQGAQNQRPSMKEEATPKCKGLNKTKTSDKKRGKPKM